ncbi:MAG: heterodisulfide reductase-related iron-sulfur binding cluster, partial [Pseudomonadota bacterium]
GFYPGCSLEATARDYLESVHGAAELLELELNEIPDWNCCGASAAHALDHRASLNLAARNLALAQQGPQPVLVPCALCFNRLKTAQFELAQDRSLLLPEIARLLSDLDAVQVVELNSYLTSPEMIAQAEAKAQDQLSGLRPVVYYGCQGQRPPAITGHPAHENPMGIDRLLEALGAEVIDWPFKTDCCGASHSVARPDLVHTLVGRLYERALEREANCIVTGCQMCQANLDLYQAEIAAEMGREVYLPVFYFTELIGLALGHKQTSTWLKRHMVNPRNLLIKSGLTAETLERL